MRRFETPRAADADPGAGAGGGAEEPVSVEHGAHLRLLRLPGCDALDHVVVSRHIIHDHMCRSLETALDSLTLHLARQAREHAEGVPAAIREPQAGPKGAATGDPGEHSDGNVGVYGGVDWRPRRMFHF